MDVDARLEALEAENERLRDRNDQLEEMMGLRLPFILPPEWCLTASEARVFGALLKADSCTKERIMGALYEAGADSEPQIKIIDVFICKLRKKIGPFGVQILTIWGQGYRMAPEAKALARRLIAGTTALEAA